MKTNTVTNTFHPRPLFSLQHLIILLLLSTITNDLLSTYLSTGESKPTDGKKSTNCSGNVYYLITLVEATNPDLVASFKDETEQQHHQDAPQFPPCSIGYFQCDDGDHCVKQSYICDNYKDCNDGSDERNCTCKGKAPYYNKTISKRSNEDRETSITNCTLTGVPTNCTCVEANLFCVNLNYRSVPFYLDPKIKKIDMSGNQIYSLSDKYFDQNLKSLTLIYVYAFQNLTNLRELNLDGNKITFIRQHSFDFNTKLQVLNLSHNPLVNISKSTFIGLKNLKELDLRYCKLGTIVAATFSQLVNLKKLWLQHNQIQTISDDGFLNLQKLEILSLSSNKIKNFSENYMFDLIRIKSLSLSYNKIMNIDHQFGNSLTLEKLDLSHNHITKFLVDSFKNQTNLITLDLRGNPFKKLPSNIFTDLPKLTTIYFDDFKMCSYAANVPICHPGSDGISSFHHLLDNIKLRRFVWIAAFIACVGNISILIRRMLVVKPNEIHSFFTKNLAIANFLMGIYLFIIALADVAFRNEYFRHQLFWHSSWLCHLSGVISMISSESSVLILALIMADQYLSIVHRFPMKRRTMQYANLGILLVWIISICIAIIPLIVTFLFTDDFYGNNGVCLALQIYETFSAGWEYSFLIFCGLNSMAFTFIAYAYIRMWFKRKEPNTGFCTTRQPQDRSIGKRWACIAATNGIGWLLIVVFKIAALNGISMNHDRYAWMAIVLLSVNSALNPVVYMLTSQTLKRHLNCFKSSSRHYDYHGSDVIYQK